MTKSKHTTRNTKTGKYDKTGISDKELYKQYQFCQGVIKRIKDIKSDLQRNVKPFYKYDELIFLIKEYQNIIKKKDELKQLS